MLAQNFLTATDLCLTADQHDTLIRLLYDMETGAIPDRLFDMNDYGMPLAVAPTPACIIGWAVAYDQCAFAHRDYRFHGTLGPLGWPENDGCEAGNKANVEQAAQALRNLLTTGEPKWHEVMYPDQPISGRLSVRDLRDLLLAEMRAVMRAAISGGETATCLTAEPLPEVER